VIGGKGGIGQGWPMLMSCLAAGRSISLPATSAAASKSMLRNTSAYARIRRQFGLPIGYMEGIEEPLARMAETAYTLEAARAVTATMVGEGEKPSVISALLKYVSTTRMRMALDDAMDIHGGRAICDGPSNYLQGAYQMMPVGITVEGANILTRSLIVFAQGSIRCHPYLLAEIEALSDPDQQSGVAKFEQAFMGHIGFSLSNVFAAFWHNLTGGVFVASPGDSGLTKRWWRQLGRASRSFALVADMSVILLGGSLKRRQRLTGRLADALSELYLLSCILKRFEDDGSQPADRALMHYSAKAALARFDAALDAALADFPHKAAGLVLRELVFPYGMRRNVPSDAEAHAIVRACLQPGAFRDRLTRDIYVSDDPAMPAGLLEHTLKALVANEAAEQRLESAIRKGEIVRNYDSDWIAQAQAKGIVDAEEADRLTELEALITRAIAVDQFDPSEFMPKSQPDAEPAPDASRHMAAE
jgi:acyl-CoA dehydrogenase